MNPTGKHSRDVRRSIAVLKASGYCCTRLTGAFGEFDILGISSVSLVLVRVCTKVPFEGYLDDLRAVRVPANALKLLHVWKRRKRLPECEDI